MKFTFKHKKTSEIKEIELKDEKIQELLIDELYEEAMFVEETDWDLEDR